MGLIKKFADFAGVKHEIDPTGHSHTTSEGWLSAIVGSLTSMINGKAASVHTHTKSQITDFAHTHAQSDVTGLADALSGKAASTHTHTKSQITDFAHTHDQSDVTGLADALSGKAASTHTHTKSQITDFAHTHAQSDVTGLEDELYDKEDKSNKIASWNELVEFGTYQYPCAKIVKDSFDEKLGSTVNNLTATESEPADSDDLTAGALYLIDNTRQVVATRPKLNQIITCDAGSGHHLCWHLDSGNLIKNYFMIRVFNWSKQVGTTTNIYHFVEVVGAWD